MMQRRFQDMELPLLGFGAMRLPITVPNDSTSIDEAAVNEMVRYSFDHGVRYFDTAHPYHDGESERVLGRVLKQFPRDSYYLATKYPGHQLSESYNPEKIFEEQLQKCGVDYFDFYLLHNVNEKSIPVYMDPRWGIVDYFLEQKRNGRIRHLGFSSHGGVENLREFLDKYGDVMEFGQIQLNYLDWTLQNAKTKYDILTERSIPVWVMEPVRGGKLAQLPEREEEKLKALRPQESLAAWAFRFLHRLPNIGMILSGMTNMEHVTDNVETFTRTAPLSEEEVGILLELAEGMKNSLPCTSCRYCCPKCPKELDIPTLLDFCNEVRFSPNIQVAMRITAQPEEKHPNACIACGACSKICPQNIDIPAALAELAEALAKMPSWEEISRQREEAARRAKK